jgi:hypothetical protein
VAELAHWSLEAPEVRAERAVVAARLLLLLGLAAGAVSLAGLLLVASASLQAGGVVLDAVGVAAAVAVVTALGLLVRRRAPR